MMSTPAKRLSALPLAALLLAIGASEAAGQPLSESVPVFPPGVHYARLSRTAGAPIRYAIAIPADYMPSSPVPLVLALHYGGSPAGGGSRVLKGLVYPALEPLGAIIVAPDSVAGAWDTPGNERAVILLLDEVLSSYSIDAKKVVVTGFSMGGAGTWYFADRYPERFSAAIPVAGRPTASAKGWRVPVLAIHSRDDERVPIEPAEARIAELKEARVRAEIIVLTGIAHYATSRYVDALRNAVPWLQEIWKQ
jgi:predicted peptidase